MNTESSEISILVAYFSNTGTTEGIAEMIQEQTGADLFEIIPEDPYTEEDLAYYTGGRADQEQEDASVRPAISGNVEHMEQYDTVFIGYPIWHGQAPRIISIFLESYDFAGKRLVPFCTSHSSGLGSSAEENCTILPRKQTGRMERVLRRHPQRRKSFRGWNLWGLQMKLWVTLEYLILILAPYY